MGASEDLFLGKLRRVKKRREGCRVTAERMEGINRRKLRINEQIENLIYGKKEHEMNH